MSEISGQSGRQFDPQIVAAFLRVLPDIDAEPGVRGVDAQALAL